MIRTMAKAGISMTANCMITPDFSLGEEVLKKYSEEQFYDFVGTNLVFLEFNRVEAASEPEKENVQVVLRLLLQVLSDFEQKNISLHETLNPITLITKNLQDNLTIIKNYSTSEYERLADIKNQVYAYMKSTGTATPGPDVAGLKSKKPQSEISKVEQIKNELINELVSYHECVASKTEITKTRQKEGAERQAEALLRSIDPVNPDYNTVYTNIYNGLYSGAWGSIYREGLAYLPSKNQGGKLMMPYGRNISIEGKKRIITSVAGRIAKRRINILHRRQTNVQKMNDIVILREIYRAKREQLFNAVHMLASDEKQHIVNQLLLENKLSDNSQRTMYETSIEAPQIILKTDNKGNEIKDGTSSHSGITVRALEINAEKILKNIIMQSDVNSINTIIDAIRENLNKFTEDTKNFTNAHFVTESSSDLHEQILRTLNETSKVGSVLEQVFEESRREMVLRNVYHPENGNQVSFEKSLQELMKNRRYTTYDFNNYENVILMEHSAQNSTYNSHYNRDYLSRNYSSAELINRELINREWLHRNFADTILTEGRVAERRFAEGYLAQRRLVERRFTESSILTENLKQAVIKRFFDETENSTESSRYIRELMEQSLVLMQKSSETENIRFRRKISNLSEDANSIQEHRKIEKRAYREIYDETRTELHARERKAIDLLKEEAAETRSLVRKNITTLQNNAMLSSINKVLKSEDGLTVLRNVTVKNAKELSALTSPLASTPSLALTQPDVHMHLRQESHKRSVTNELQRETNTEIEKSLENIRQETKNGVISSKEQATLMRELEKRLKTQETVINELTRKQINSSQIELSGVEIQKIKNEVINSLQKELRLERQRRGME